VLDALVQFQLPPKFCFLLRFYTAKITENQNKKKKIPPPIKHNMHHQLYSELLLPTAN